MRKIIKYGIFLVWALSLLILYALTLSDPSNDGTKLENNSNEPIGLNIYIDFIWYTHEELRDHSDTIVIGTVKEILPPRWNTIDGKQPNKPLTELDHLNDTIYTDIVISVDEYLKNPFSSGELIVRSIGGTVGNVSMTSDAEPTFKTGEKVLLYLSEDTDPSTKDLEPEHFIVTDFYEGKFTLTDDGKAIGHVENTTLDELLSTINQTENSTNDTEASDNTEASGNQEGVGSTIQSKRIPFMNFFWTLAAVLGAVLIVRHSVRHR